MRKTLLPLCLTALFLPLTGWFTTTAEPDKEKGTSAPAVEPDRSPVDVVLTPDEKWLLTANQSSGTVSLADLTSGLVVAEAECGKRPTGLALTPDGRHVLVTATDGGNLTVFERQPRALKRVADVHLGFEPRGVVVAPDGKLAYVALTSADAIAVVDLVAHKEIDRIKVGRWPRSIALTPDGKRLAVATGGGGGIAVVDTVARKQLYLEDFSGINLGQVHVSNDGKHAYVGWMLYRINPITVSNIRRGWVLASRVARVRLDEKTWRDAIALDVPGKAVSDPYGMALSPGEEWMVSTGSGTHELLAYRMDGLPWASYSGPSDHIDPRLSRDRRRFFRIDLGGRPMTTRFSRDGKHVYVANYLLNCVQVVNLEERKIVRTIELGGPKEPSLARQGEAIFYDGQRSLDQWYSCHSCHTDGHTNAVAMDTRNDGRFGNFKTVLSLRNVTHTGPWTWHGWQDNLDAAMEKSLRETMLTQKPITKDDQKALVAYLETLKPPPNPYRNRDGSLTEAAQRGKLVFESKKAACARCHTGEYFTDGKQHGVGLTEEGDVYRGFNTPSLIGAYDRVKYLHDGRAESLEEILKGDHAPDKVSGKGKLTEQELRDLIEYVKSL